MQDDYFCNVNRSINCLLYNNKQLISLLTMQKQSSCTLQIFFPCRSTNLKWKRKWIETSFLFSPSCHRLLMNHCFYNIAGWQKWFPTNRQCIPYSALSSFAHILHKLQIKAITLRQYAYNRLLAILWREQRKLHFTLKMFWESCSA